MRREYIAEDLYDPCGSLIGVQDHGELIRCKDCKHWDTNWQTIEGKHYCPYIDTHQRGDWYCAWAERKEE